MTASILVQLPVAAQVVDWQALLRVVVYSLVVVAGVSAAFSIGIVGAGRVVDSRRAGHSLPAILYSVVVAIAFGLCAAAIVTGIVVMTQK
jgi:hypothetical protein